MSVLDGLLQAVIESPLDYAPRGVLADWLEDHGDERANEVRTAESAFFALRMFPDERSRLSSTVDFDYMDSREGPGTGTVEPESRTRVVYKDFEPETAGSQPALSVVGPNGLRVDDITIHNRSSKPQLARLCLPSKVTVLEMVVPPFGSFRWVSGLNQPVQGNDLEIRLSEPARIIAVLYLPR